MEEGRRFSGPLVESGLSAAKRLVREGTQASYRRPLLQTSYPPDAKAGQVPVLVGGLSLWSWMLPPPGPEPPNV